MHPTLRLVAVGGFVLAIACASASLAAPPMMPIQAPALTLGYAAQDQKATSKPADAKPSKDAKTGKEAAPAAGPDKPGSEATTQRSAGQHHEGGMFKDVSHFWNIREAYSDVGKGEWEVEAYGSWMTYKKGRDQFELTQSIYYGITDDWHLELEVAEPAGSGGDGVGELEFTVFGTLWHETELLPAFAISGALRIPTGYGSSRVDGTYTAMLTKEIFPKFRVHMMGYLENAAGARGDQEEIGRRAFQWGVGPGFDYQLFDNTLFVLNYLHASSDSYGDRNSNILELGFVQKLGKLGPFNHTIKFAGDIGLDGDTGTPNGGLKLSYDIEW